MLRIGIGFGLNRGGVLPPSDPPFNPDDFIIKVKTDNAGTSGDNQFTFTGGVGDYDVEALNVATNNTQSFTGLSGSATLTFTEGAGEYILNVIPVGETPFSRVRYNNGGDRLKLLEIKNWGSIQWTDFDGAFRGCSNVIVTATDVPDCSLLDGISIHRAKWLDCTSLEEVSYNGADFTGVKGATVTSPYGMFNGTTNLKKVDFRNVQWNTNDLIICRSWFDLSGVEEIIGLENCNIKPSNLLSAFRCKVPHLDLRAFDTSGLTDVSFLVDNVFTEVKTIDCTGWDWSEVTTMLAFARNNTHFEEIIGLSTGQDMKKCTTFELAFSSATSWNQLFAVQLRLAGVNLSQVFRSTAMSTENYTDTIVYWANYAFENSGTPINVDMSGQTGRTFDTSRSGGANFDDAGDARNYLTTTLGWTISGDTTI